MKKININMDDRLKWFKEEEGAQVNYYSKLLIFRIPMVEKKCIQ